MLSKSSKAKYDMDLQFMWGCSDRNIGEALAGLIWPDYGDIIQICGFQLTFLNIYLISKKDGAGLNVSWVSWDIFEKIYAFLSIPLCNLPIRNTIRRSGNSKNRYHCNYCTKLDDNIFLCLASNENVNVRRHRSKQHPPQSRPNNN